MGTVPSLEAGSRRSNSLNTLQAATIWSRRAGVQDPAEKHPMGKMRQRLPTPSGN